MTMSLSISATVQNLPILGKRHYIDTLVRTECEFVIGAEVGFEFRRYSYSVFRVQLMVEAPVERIHQSTPAV